MRSHAGDLQTRARHDIPVRMVRFAPLLRVLGCTALMAAPVLRAQNTLPSPSVTPVAAVSSAEDLHTLRQLVEQQSRQIETLTQQVSKLAQLLEPGHAGAAAATPAATQNMPPVSESSPMAAEPPKAVLAQPPSEPGSTHVVAKGETLTVIAKQYKVSVGELLKANKIEDARKLQIGQTLIIPTKPAAESPHP